MFTRNGFGQWGATTYPTVALTGVNEIFNPTNISPATCDSGVFNDVDYDRTCDGCTTVKAGECL